MVSLSELKGRFFANKILLACLVVVQIQFNKKTKIRSLEHLLIPQPSTFDSISFYITPISIFFFILFRFWVIYKN